MLIEIRIGPGKWKIKDWISHFCERCQIPDDKIHRVPHISLYGGFSANPDQVEKIKSVLSTVGRKYSFLPFTIDGLQSIQAEKGMVVYFNIRPSENLKQFRNELATNLFPIVPDTKPFDFNKDFLFHSTLSNKLSDSEYGRILNYVDPLSPNTDNSVAPYFYLPMAALRITLLNNEARIICEYDLLQHRLLTRLESLSKQEWQKTSKLFRIKKGMEKYHERSDSIYFIGDLHFSHSNIIDYCARPFLSSDVNEMNTVLVENWNNVIDDTNIVYFLGDLDSKDSIGHWIRNLNGKKIFIEGNHDIVKNREGIVVRHKIHGAKHHCFIPYKGHLFYLVHNPRDVDMDWRRDNPEGWLIHGHTHDNDIHKYPFINGKKKTISVSAEVINYRPVSLDYILSLNLDSIERMDTIDSIPQRKVRNWGEM
jgi:calcineurin-like phosphoesterase family protein/2'-5' RNA ligase